MPPIVYPGGLLRPNRRAITQQERAAREYAEYLDLVITEATAPLRDILDYYVTSGDNLSLIFDAEYNAAAYRVTVAADRSEEGVYRFQSHSEAGHPTWVNNRQVSNITFIAETLRGYQHRIHLASLTAEQKAAWAMARAWLSEKPAETLTL